jgi:hypothetical protein
MTAAITAGARGAHAWRRPAMRAIGILAIFSLQGLAAAAETSANPIQGKPHCEWLTFGGDHREFKCPLNASGTTQSFRFKAMFSGGHDDTSAKLTATLDEQPLACEEGSKTSLLGEDGDVMLECRFSIKDKAGTASLLGVTLVWSHAQYTGIEFGSD